METIKRRDVEIAICRISENQANWQGKVKPINGGILVRIGALANCLQKEMGFSAMLSSPRKVGAILRNQLEMEVLPRMSDGFWLFVDERQLEEFQQAETTRSETQEEKQARGEAADSSPAWGEAMSYRDLAQEVFLLRKRMKALEEQWGMRPVYCPGCGRKVEVG